jgi:hypothetical protein
VSNGPDLRPIGADTTSSRRSMLEMLAVLLLGLATVATAWSGYQSSQWSGNETTEARNATNQRIESSRLFSLASQKVAYDAGIVAQYAQAAANEQTKLMAFIRANLVRPEFLPTLDAWEAAVKAGGGQAANLFTNTEYLNAQFKPSKDAQAIGDAASLRSEEASKHSSDYILITLVTATALFFAGVTTSFKSPLARLLLLAIAGLTLAYAASRLVSLPVA